jgi:hypothetical protein
LLDGFQEECEGFIIAINKQSPDELKKLRLKAKKDLRQAYSEIKRIIGPKKFKKMKALWKGYKLEEEIKVIEGLNEKIKEDYYKAKKFIREGGITREEKDDLTLFIEKCNQDLVVTEEGEIDDIEDWIAARVKLFANDCRETDRKMWWINPERHEHWGERSPRQTAINKGKDIYLQLHMRLNTLANRERIKKEHADRKTLYALGGNVRQIIMRKEEEGRAKCLEAQVDTKDNELKEKDEEIKNLREELNQANEGLYPKTKSFLWG